MLINFTITKSRHGQDAVCAQTGWLRYCSLRLTAYNGESNVPIIRMKCMLCFRICLFVCLCEWHSGREYKRWRNATRKECRWKLVDYIRCANGRQTTADEAIRYAIHIMMHIRTYMSDVTFLGRLVSVIQMSVWVCVCNIETVFLVQSYTGFRFLSVFGWLAAYAFVDSNGAQQMSLHNVWFPLDLDR